MSKDQDEYQDDDERDDFASRSIFAAGWFRAVLVLTVLAIVVVISLPYLLNWFEPAPPPARVAKPADAPAPVAPAPVTPPAAVVPPPAPSPAPTPPAATAPKATPPAPKAAAPATPAPSPKVETPPAAMKAQAEKAPEQAAAPAPKATADKAAASAAKAAAAKATEEKAAADKAAAEKATAEKAAAKKAAEKATAEKVAAKKAADKAAADKAAAEKASAKAAAPTRTAKVAEPATKSDAAAGSGNFWIQLGAFKEQKNADNLAKAVRDQGFPVQVTPVGRSGNAEVRSTSQQHELFVTETSVEKVNAALKGNGSAQPVAGGVAVRPALSLQEAMSVSRRLTDDGFKVVIRPAGTAATPQQATLHAVRVGGYPDRAKAQAARAELEAKGHSGFLAEGPAK